jgi:hypothetical protein
MYENVTGSNNVMIGDEAGRGSAGNSYSNNTAVGHDAGTAITTGGDNTLLGYQAGDVITTGTNNICIGESTDPTANNATYELNIGNTLYGDLSATKIGVGTATPATTLELEYTETLGASPADAYAACLTLDPGYTGAFTVTRHNYIDVQRPSVAGGAAVTDAAVMRFDDTIANHEALETSFTTTDSNGDTTTWDLGVKVNVNGTLYKLAAIAA